MIMIICILMNIIFCYIGADVNITNDEDKTPLMIACRLEYIDIVKLLLLYKAYINHHSNYEGYDALLEAICSTTCSSCSMDISSSNKFSYVDNYCSTTSCSNSNSNHQYNNDIVNESSCHESCQKKIKLITLLINSGKHLNLVYKYICISYIYISIYKT